MEETVERIRRQFCEDTFFSPEWLKEIDVEEYEFAAGVLNTWEYGPKDVYTCEKDLEEFLMKYPLLDDYVNYRKYQHLRSLVSRYMLSLEHVCVEMNKNKSG